MIIYFDESYSNEAEYFLLGALFNPHSKFLHRKLGEIKKKYSCYKNDGTLGEIKYNNCKTKDRLDICCEAIDAFFESTSWFRCIVVEKKYFDLNNFGKIFEDDKIKKARAYKKFAELLLAHNTENIQGGVLLTDQMSRCRRDLFLDKMTELFCRQGEGYSKDKQKPTLNRVEEVASDLEQYQVLQICDLLMGCVLNNLMPTKNEYKQKLREHLIRRLGVIDLLPSTWSHYSKRDSEEYHPKFNIWYLRPSEKKNAQAC